MIELKINGQIIDVKEDVYFPLTFSQADAKQPDKRKRDSSKTIVLPGTQRNNKFFSSAWDLRITDVFGDLVGFDFDPTLRYPAIVRRNGEVVFDGGATLSKVIVKSGMGNGQINEYHIVLYSVLADLFQSLGDLKVSELGWQEYDHDLTIANIVDSWTAVEGSGYWYPLIDYGLSDNPIALKTNQLRPHVYKKEIMEKCFSVGGFTLASSFYSSPLIRRIAWGSGGGEPLNITSIEVAERSLSYTSEGEFLYFNLPPTSREIGPLLLIGYNFDYTKTMPLRNIDLEGQYQIFTEIFDDLNQFEPSGGEIVVANSGDYRIEINATLPVYASVIATFNSTLKIDFVFRLFLNDAVVFSSTESITETGILPDYDDDITFDITQDLHVNNGDIIKADIQILTAGSNGIDRSGAQLDIVVGGGVDKLDTTFKMTCLNLGLVDGDPVQISRFLPDMLAADFIRDEITMYNLYLTDPNENNAIIIEPITDYFNDSDEADNWSDKLDRSQEIEIEPAANIQGKTYSFKFAEDRDYYKQRYYDLFGHDYGDYDYNVPSTFKKGEIIYQLKSAQSCPVQIEGTDIIMPRIIKVNETSFVTTPHKGKPRIYFNNGLVNSDNWVLINSDTLVGTTFNFYPQAHHLDDLDEPTFDLNFNRPEMVFYTATSYTNDNLFSRFNLSFIRELTSRDSKILRGWFRLDERDFYNNFMRNLANIDGVIYRKNLVSDWIANSNNLVKVELIKLIEVRSRKNSEVGVPDVPKVPIGVVGDVVSDIDATNNQVFYKVDTTVGNVIVTLDKSKLNIGWTGEFIKTVASNTFTLSGGSTSTINGSGTINFNNQYDSVKVRFDGNDFYIV